MLVSLPPLATTPTSKLVMAIAYVYSSIDGDVSAHAEIDAQYIDTVTFRGDVAVTANANGSHVGSIEANGNDAYVGTGDGDVYGEVRGSAYVEVEDASNATFNGKLNVTANANGNMSVPLPPLAMATTSSPISRPTSRLKPMSRRMKWAL